MLEEKKVKTHNRVTNGSLVLSHQKLEWNFNSTWKLLLRQRTNG